MEWLCRASAARQLTFGEPTIKNQDPELEDLINESNRVHRDAMQDLIRVDEQAASLAVCEEFLIKFVLLYNCEWFQGRAVPLPPPGVKAMPHKSAQLWMDWGKRYKVILPPPEQVQDAPEDENDQDHERRHPVRHWVRGFFRSQPYGPGRTLRKVLWIARRRFLSLRSGGTESTLTPGGHGQFRGCCQFCVGNLREHELAHPQLRRDHKRFFR